MSMTLMEHPDHGLKQVPLNEWARYRKSGWAFCNDKAKTLAQAQEVAQAQPGDATGSEEEVAEAEAPAKKSSKPRTTSPKKD